jgi:hypothetical protein
MQAKSYRIYLRGSPITFWIILSLISMAVMFGWVFFTESDSSRFNLGPPILGLIALAYFVHKASLSWIRILHDGSEMVRVPSWFARRLLGEKRTVATIPPNSELILCRRFEYGGIQGYYMIVRAPDGAEQIIWNDVTGVTRRQWSRIANEIGKRSQLKVRLVSQTVSTSGIEETDWTALSDKGKWKFLRLMVGPALAPWLGIGIRFLTPKLWSIALAGTILWLAGCAMFWYIYRTVEISKEESPAITILVWTIQFITLYVLAVLFTGAFLKG